VEGSLSFHRNPPHPVNPVLSTIMAKSVKGPGREADHSLPSSGEDKDA